MIISEILGGHCPQLQSLGGAFAPSCPMAPPPMLSIYSKAKDIPQEVIGLGVVEKTGIEIDGYNFHC